MSFQYGDALVYASYIDSQATSTRDVSLRQRAVNDASFAMHTYGGRLLDCDRYYQQYLMAAAYQPATTTATVAATVGSGTVTGTGTAFTSSMVGRFARIAGTFETYIVTAYSSATSITIQPFLGSTDGYQGPNGNQTAASIAITQNRVLLPDNFRTVDTAQIDYGYGYLDGSKTRSDISYLLMNVREVSIPRCFCTETDKSTSTSALRDYLNIYPPPSSAHVLRVFMYAFPNVCTATTDEFGINGYALPAEYEEPLRMYIEAYIAKNRRDPDWQALMERAHKATDAQRTNSSPKQKMQWTPETDSRGSNQAFAYPFGNVLNQASM